MKTYWAVSNITEDAWIDNTGAWTTLKEDRHAFTSSKQAHDVKRRFKERFKRKVTVFKVKTKKKKV